MQCAQRRHRHCHCQRCRRIFIRKGTPIFVIHCKCFTIEINFNRSLWNKSYKRALTETTNTNMKKTTHGWQSHFEICFSNWIVSAINIFMDDVTKYERRNFLPDARKSHVCFAGILHEQHHFQYSVRHVLEHEWFETRHHYSKLLSFSTILQMIPFRTCWSIQKTPADIPFFSMVVERKMLLVILIFEFFFLHRCLCRDMRSY